MSFIFCVPAVGELHYGYVMPPTSISSQAQYFHSHQGPQGQVFTPQWARREPGPYCLETTCDLRAPRDARDSCSLGLEGRTLNFH